MENKIQKLLCELGLSNRDSIIPYYPTVRDRDDISILKCTNSGVLFLSRTDHMEVQHYREKQDFDYWKVDTHDQASKLKKEDHERRFNDFKHFFVNKDWADIGTGEGSILKLFSTVTKSATGVELQGGVRKNLINAGLNVKASVGDLEAQAFDMVTLFHVYEHFTNPIEELSEIREKLRPGGKVIIEVPHAKDFLIDFLQCESFKKFTFWSEHLILHTRLSLERFMRAAGFENVVVTAVQRYPLANHFHWLAKNQPGGQEKWGMLKSPELDQAYANKLASLDMTDTLVAIGENPSV